MASPNAFVLENRFMCPVNEVKQGKWNWLYLTRVLDTLTELERYMITRQYLEIDCR